MHQLQPILQHPFRRGEYLGFTSSEALASPEKIPDDCLVLVQLEDAAVTADETYMYPKTLFQNICMIVLTGAHKTHMTNYFGFSVFEHGKGKGGRVYRMAAIPEKRERTVTRKDGEDVLWTSAGERRISQGNKFEGRDRESCTPAASRKMRAGRHAPG